MCRMKDQIIVTLESFADAIVFLDLSDDEARALTSIAAKVDPVNGTAELDRLIVDRLERRRLMGSRASVRALNAAGSVPDGDALLASAG